jgi:calcineurin-like phosphoesterase family protein
MDEALVANYNECVKPKDTVYHLGDFSFARNPAAIFYRLNGNKHLVLGNHDWKRLGDLKKLPWGWIKDVYNLRVGGTKIWLNHFAQRVWPAGHHGAIHLYGHSHGSLPDFGRSTDVGVDAWDYRPVHLDEILDLMKDRETIKHH